MKYIQFLTSIFWTSFSKETRNNPKTIALLSALGWLFPIVGSAAPSWGAYPAFALSVMAVVVFWKAPQKSQ